VLDSLRLFAKEVMPHFQGASDTLQPPQRPLMPPRLASSISLHGQSAPTINGYKTEPWILKGAKSSTINMEIDDDLRQPAAGHDASIDSRVRNFLRYDVSREPGGCVLDCRGSRLGPHRRATAGFVLRSYCDNDDARRELAARWGYPTVAGDVKLDIRHDRVVARVGAGGKPVLECELLDRDMISGGDIQYIASMPPGAQPRTTRSWCWCRSIPSSRSRKRSAASRGLS